MTRLVNIVVWRSAMAALCLLMSFAALPAARADEAPGAGPVKVALVIGNSAYRSVPPLTNPASDAQDVAAAFGRLGFTVDTLTDVGFDQMRRALLAFGRKAQGADMAVIYFAGHGMEIGGNNWLVPVDAELKTDIDVENEAINLNSAMLAVSDTQSLGLIILDSCRSNPFQAHIRKAGGASRSIDRALGPIEPNDNVMVAYAARDGTTAQDGEGRHSPFTAALLSHLETPGLEINFLFRNIRDDVVGATDHGQEPYVYGSLSKEAIYLAPPRSAVAAGPPIGADEIAWSVLQGSNDVGTLQRFVGAFAASPRAAEARARIASLTSPRADASQPLAAVAAWGAPLPSFNDLLTSTAGARDDETLKTIARKFSQNSAEVDKAWDIVKASADPKALRSFVDEFPTTPRRLTIHPRPVHSVVRVPLKRPANPLRVAARDPDDLPWVAWARPAVAGVEAVAVVPTDNGLVGALTKDYEIRNDRNAGACDRLAADPDDAGRPPGLGGTALAQIDGPGAIAACSAAVASYPDVPRLRYQLCRAYMKVGDLKRASEQCAAAAEASPADAFGLPSTSYYATVVPGFGLPAPAAAFDVHNGIPVDEERNAARSPQVGMLAAPPSGLPGLAPPVIAPPSAPGTGGGVVRDFKSKRLPGGHGSTVPFRNGLQTGKVDNVIGKPRGTLFRGSGGRTLAGNRRVLQPSVVSRTTSVVRRPTIVTEPHLAAAARVTVPISAVGTAAAIRVARPTVATPIRINAPTINRIVVPTLHIQTPVMIRRPGS